MRKLRYSLFTILVGFILTVSALTSSAQTNQPNMQAALKNLNSAQKSLRKATPDKGGHRGNAMKLVSDAIIEVNAGIAAGNRQSNFDESSLTADESSLSAFDQGNMEAAKNYLNSALNNLQSAADDKAGHRTTAIRLVRNAIEEVQAGIDYAQ